MLEIPSPPKMAKLSSTPSSFPWSRSIALKKSGLGLLHRHFDPEDRREAGGVPISPRFPFQLMGRYCHQAGLSKRAGSSYESYFAPLNGRPRFKSVDLTDLSIQRLSEGIYARCHDCEPRRLCPASPVNMPLAKHLRVQLLPRERKCASQAQ
jgi:hypothetical protein